MPFTDNEALEALDAQPAPTPLRVVPPLPAARRSDGLIKVRMSPLVMGDPDSFDGNDSGLSETVVDQQLIVDYTGALARRTAVAIRDNTVEQIDNRHEHPRAVTCLRCAVLGAGEHRTLAVTLLEILARNNADEEWNNDLEKCTTIKMISRLRRLAVSSASMEEIHGTYWGAVMLMCLRIERADFELLDYLTRKYQPSRVLNVHTRESLAAYHLAMVTCPWISRDGRPIVAVRRNAVAVRLGVAAASVAMGDLPQWLDHLPVPAL